MALKKSPNYCPMTMVSTTCQEISGNGPKIGTGHTLRVPSQTRRVYPVLPPEFSEVATGTTTRPPCVPLSVAAIRPRTAASASGFVSQGFPLRYLTPYPHSLRKSLGIWVGTGREHPCVPEPNRHKPEGDCVQCTENASRLARKGDAHRRCVFGVHPANSIELFLSEKTDSLSCTNSCKFLIVILLRLQRCFAITSDSSTVVKSFDIISDRLLDFSFTGPSLTVQTLSFQH